MYLHYTMAVVVNYIYRFRIYIHQVIAELYTNGPKFFLKVKTERY